MSEFEKKRLDREFEIFASRNFEKPRRCKNLEQARYYVQELSDKVSDLKKRFNYVPESAYSLLAQYNQIQNKLIYREFKNTY